MDIASTVCSLLDTAGTSNNNLCICQKRKCKRDKLSDLKYAGLRRELHDAGFAATIVRIEQTLTNSEEKFKYHCGCYSNFANSGRLLKLRKKSAAPSQNEGCTATEPSTSRYITRTQTDRVDIK
ncbi:hypothetical protein JTB14_037791 [Gonioctena quinquepunctata]|nr:hypothetical protein JTB14_037791 [Gonioctena quinquepunctata]